MSYNHSGNSGIAVPNSNVGQIVPYELCSQVCMLDARLLEEKANIKTFVSSNIEQYYVCINTWVALTYDALGESACYTLEEIILRVGLIKTIDVCSSLANNLIARLDGSKEQAELPEWAPPLAYHLLSTDDDQLSLQVLRFPKRFTLLGSVHLRDSSYEKFIDILSKNNWRKVARERYLLLLDRDPAVSSPDFGFLGELVKKYVNRILGSFDPSRVSTYPWKFSSGVCHAQDGKSLRGVFSKMDEVNNFTHQFDSPLMPLPDTSRILRKEWYPSVIDAVGVPKSYKTYRIITPEDVMRSIAMQQCRRELERVFSSSPYSDLYTKESQSANCDMAQDSSVSTEYATIDLSSASDSISRHLARYLLPEHVWDFVSPLLPQKIRVNGKVYTNSIFLTSGDPCTFDFESIIFLSIALAARELHHNWCNYWARKPRVYGDDIIVDIRTIEETCSILDRLGFCVNYDKSFWAGKYRESCGVEYYAGYDVSTSYWPRKGLRFSGVSNNVRQQSLTSLISMQHRLFNYPRAARFLRNQVLLVEPRMTFSTVGTECTDLWGSVSSFVPRTAPFDRSSGTAEELRARYGECVNREGHLTLVQKVQEDYVSNPYVQLYAYYTFLAEGPQYDDELSRLLGVSTSRINGASPDSPMKWVVMSR